MGMKKRIAVLGSTGSVGTQALQCCKRQGYDVTVLAANRNVNLLEQQTRAFSPHCVVISDKSAYREIKTRLADTGVRLLAGMDGLCEAASLEENEIVCNALVGMIGLRPTLAALDARKTVALANKETLVAAGALVMARANEKDAEILPVDSEHSAIFQCLCSGRWEEIRKIILTCSGGPFFGKSASELEQMTVADALNHPNWSMGHKITIDSATLMNKGLEFIEAMWLFALQPEQIEIVIHPQSIVHSAVEFRDGAVIAQMGIPDMQIPIQYALTYPERCPTHGLPLSLTEAGKLTFAEPDYRTFACLRHCLEAARRGGLYPCAVNGANEQAVALFLAGKIGFGQIGRAVGYVLGKMNCKDNGLYTLEEVLETTETARQMVLEYCKARPE